MHICISDSITLAGNIIRYHLTVRFQSKKVFKQTKNLDGAARRGHIFDRVSWSGPLTVQCAYFLFEPLRRSACPPPPPSYVFPNNDKTSQNTLLDSSSWVPLNLSFRPLNCKLSAVDKLEPWDRPHSSTFKEPFYTSLTSAGHPL